METFDDEILVKLIAELYESAVDPTLWPIFLNQLAEILQVNVAGMSVFAVPRPGESPNGLEQVSNQPGKSFSYAIGISTESMQSYFKHWVHTDDLTAKAVQLSLSQQKEVLIRQEISPDSAFEKSTFYNEFARREGYFHTLGAIGFSEGDAYSLSLNRPKIRGEFTQDEAKWLSTLTPHLKRALSIHQKLSLLRLQTAAYSQILQAAGQSCLIVSGSMRILWMDASAEQLLASHSGLLAKGGYLHTKVASDHRNLAEAVARTLQIGSNLQGISGQCLWIKESEFKTRKLWIYPALSTLGRPPEPSVLILVQADRNSNPHFHSTLQNRFQLTPAECRVALALLQGLTPQEISEKSNRSVGTIRNQVKQVLHKTGCRRQSELTKKLTTILEGSN